jgi:hypothetical protein
VPAGYADAAVAHVQPFATVAAVAVQPHGAAVQQVRQEQPMTFSEHRVTTTSMPCVRW